MMAETGTFMILRLLPVGVEALSLPGAEVLALVLITLWDSRSDEDAAAAGCDVVGALASDSLSNVHMYFPDPAWWGRGKMATLHGCMALLPFSTES